MMVIVVIACMGGTCGTWVVSEPLTIAECLIRARTEGALWQMTHPEYQVESVGCQMEGLLGLPILTHP